MKTISARQLLGWKYYRERGFDSKVCPGDVKIQSSATSNNSFLLQYSMINSSLETEKEEKVFFQRSTFAPRGATSRFPNSTNTLLSLSPLFVPKWSNLCDFPPAAPASPLLAQMDLSSPL